MPDEIRFEDRGALGNGYRIAGSQRGDAVSDDDQGGDNKAAGAAKKKKTKKKVDGDRSASDDEDSDDERKKEGAAKKKVKADEAKARAKARADAAAASGNVDGLPEGMSRDEFMKAYSKVINPNGSKKPYKFPDTAPEQDAICAAAADLKKRGNELGVKCVLVTIYALQGGL